VTRDHDVIEGLDATFGDDLHAIRTSTDRLDRRGNVDLSAFADRSLETGHVRPRAASMVRHTGLPRTRSRP